MSDIQKFKSDAEKLLSDYRKILQNDLESVTALHEKELIENSVTDRFYIDIYKLTRTYNIIDEPKIEDYLSHLGIRLVSSDL